MTNARLLLCLLLVAGTSFGQTGRPITVTDLLSFGRVTDPQVSPDGKLVAYVVTRHSVTENRTNSNIYLVPTSGGATVQLTSAAGSNAQPRWISSSELAFISSRDGGSQVWRIAVTGGEARKVSSISTEASGLAVSRDGSIFAFASDVYPDCTTDDCNAQRMAAEAGKKSKARVFDHLPYRVWNAWKDGMRSHVFVQSFAGGGARDLTPGDHDSPPIDLGGAWDYAISPDAKEIAYTMSTERDIAWTTNNDLFTVPVGGGAPKLISDNPANDSQPTYSPDGRTIAYTAMRRPGFEADRRELILYDRSTGQRVNVTSGTDLSVGETVWSPDGRMIYFTADFKGRHPIFRLTVASRKVDTIVPDGSNASLSLTPDGQQLVFVRDRMNEPAEVYRVDVNGKRLTKLSAVNDGLVRELAMNPCEEFWFAGSGGTQVQGLLLKPPGFDPAKTYPLVYLIHGGPQGQWSDQFHYRWNAQLFASRGAVVALVNPRGSTGSGQEFTDQISKDWGGAAFEDLMKGVDHLLATYRFIDGTRMAAAGASYGGYMIAWIAGHTDRFRCLVDHDGVFNPWSMYGTTEELWFPEWELGGTPYAHPELYNRWSPLLSASRFVTPTLVVHGQKDFRVDVSEGFQFFTALQRQGVPSKMLYFPDEGHFVTKPANAMLWYTTVLDWIEQYVK